MSYTVSTLLLRNLRDVFGEIDPARRRAAHDPIIFINLTHDLDKYSYDPIEKEDCQKPCKCSQALSVQIK